MLRNMFFKDRLKNSSYVLGNEGSRDFSTVMYPAKHRCVISVGACDALANPTNFTANGPSVDFLCPGEKVTAAGRGLSNYFRTDPFDHESFVSQ